MPLSVAELPPVLQDLFLPAVNDSFASREPTTVPLPRRFSAVFIRDAALVSLSVERLQCYIDQGAVA